MTTNRLLARSRLVSILALSALVAGCTTKVTTGAFTQVGRLETDLRRGVSTKMDVRRVLGAPKGFGGSALPTDPKPREVWFYDDIELTDLKSDVSGVYRVSMRQQILLVFFDKEVFDGFMWVSNAGVATRQ